MIICKRRILADGNKCVGSPKLRAGGGVNDQSCESTEKGLVLLFMFDSMIGQSGRKYNFGLIFSPFFIKEKGKIK